MKTVTVSASKTYDIHIGPGLLSTVGQALQTLGGAKQVCIVSDSNVFPLYGKAVEGSLKKAGFSTASFAFPAGEASKNGTTFLELLNTLALHRMTRSDMLIALGGGVVGDLAGFAASAYLRGIRFVQIPTTLLAAVDSSVGGKTAIDLPAGKNLAGAFWQPSLVLCDTDTLNTLPEDVFRDGCAETIKYGILYDPSLFAQLERDGLSFDREDIITRCVQWKRDVVMADEFDTGARMQLNLGHTIGHGIEACSDFAISHGKAVAIGMAMVSRASSRLGICSQACADRVEGILRRFGLPVHSDFSCEALCTWALSDKKRSAGTVNLILPEEIGRCRIAPTPIEELKTLIEMGQS